MENKKKSILIISIVAIACIVMAIVDGIIQPPYVLKSFIKLIFFVMIPIIYMFTAKDKTFKQSLIPNKKRLLFSILLGLGIYIFIVGGYFIIRTFVDFSNIVKSLGDKEEINKTNFILVAIYISLVNSFCEELLFRGFAFITLKNNLSKKVAYIFSAFAFAIYHVAIMQNWFNPIIIILMILGLGIGAIILNRIDDGVDNIYPSWIIHIFANLGINTVGLILFLII